jgi:hypothetical protein
MIATLFQKVELRFWDFIIPQLTESSVLRKIVKTAVNFYHNDRLVRQVALGAILACAGFATGILAFTLSRMFG